MPDSGVTRPALPQPESRTEMLRLLLSLLRDDPRACAAVRGIIVTAALVGLLRIAALATGFLVLDPFLASDPEVSWPALAATFALVTGTLVCAWLRGRFEVVGGSRAATVIASALARQVDRLPLGWFTRVHQTELTELVTTGRDQIDGALSFRQRMLVEAAVIPVASVLAGWWIDPQIGLILAIAALVTTASALSANKPVNETMKEYMRSSAAALSELTDFVQAQPLLRAATGTDTAGARTLRAFAGMDEADRRQQRAVSIRTAMFPSVLTALAVTAIIIAAVAAPLSPAALTVGIVLALESGVALHSFGRAWAFNTTFTTMLTRIRTILDEPPLPEPASAAQPVGDDLGVGDVTFGYVAGETVLHHVSAAFPAATVTALVGPSGAGKSTLLRLLARFWDPNAGTVTLGDTDLREAGTRAVHDRIGFVFQDVSLFDGTLRENVLIARPNATDTEVVAAARRAGLDQVLADLPDGWDTRVGERGASLSGGQRQRVSIARAFLKDAPILLLDEPTASLDAENERHITDSVHALSAGRTVVTVTHRLDTAREADQIVVLDGGRVVQQGKHDQLIAEPGVYADLWAAHSRYERRQGVRR